METIELLNEAVSKVVELAKQIQNERFKFVAEHGPIIVHQRLCAKLVAAAEQNLGKIPRDVPEMVKIMDAISLVEELFPNVKIR